MRPQIRHSVSEIKRARRAAKNERSKSNRRAPLLDPTPSRRAPAPLAEAMPGPRRIALVTATLALAALLVLLRAGQLQLVDGDRYLEAAQRQASISASINAKRGVIKDRHGAELAITVDVDSVFAEPKKIDDPVRAAKELTRVLEVPAAALLKKLRSDKSFVYLKRRTNPDVAQRVRALGLRGVGTQPEPKRFYANRDLAAHVLGFASSDGEGVAGVEKELESELRGQSYEVAGLRDALGKTVFSDGFLPHAVLEGADVELTIDRQIQDAAEQALKDAVESSKGKAGVAVVLEPKSGDVLALASYPTFNPNNLKGTTPNNHLNRAVSAAYEPGSTMKMVTIAAALEDKLIAPDDRIDCEQGRFKIGKRTINDSHHGYGELTIPEIMKVSSNVCSAKIGMQLGAERLHRWIYRFGFGEKTGIELPGELKGYVRPYEAWQKIGLANVAFGQGLTVTPMQIVEAAAVIANRGERVVPRLVRAIIDKSQRRLVPERPEAARVLSQGTAMEVERMMEEVVKKGGTAEAAQVPGFRVAGKTGTAQKIDPVTHAYSHELYVASFVGFVPAQKPEAVILVLVDEPRTSIYGGVVAAPAFRRIALAALTALEVFPEDEAAREAFLASYRPKPLDRPPEATEDDDDSKPRENSGKSASEVVGIDSALSTEAQALLSGSNPSPGPGPGSGPGPGKRMPNFRGLQVREVLNRSAEAHCDPVLFGSGRVVAQSPPAGEIVTPGARCELKLSPSG